MKTFLENSLFIYLFKVFYKAIATIADSILVYKRIIFYLYSNISISYHLILIYAQTFETYNLKFCRHTKKTLISWN